MNAYESDPRWIKAHADFLQSDVKTAVGTSATRLEDGIRASIRCAQIEMLHNPNPESPWYFLVDPNTAAHP